MSYHLTPTLQGLVNTRTLTGAVVHPIGPQRRTYPVPPVVHPIGPVIRTFRGLGMMPPVRSGVQFRSVPVSMNPAARTGVIMRYPTLQPIRPQNYIPVNNPGTSTNTGAGSGCAQLSNGSMVCGPAGPGSVTPGQTGWQQGGWRRRDRDGGNGYGNPQTNPGSTAGSMNLAQLQQIYQTNPSALTSQQWSQLQAAGTIPSTLPQSDASLVPTTGSTALTTTDPTALGTTSTIPVWLYVVGGGLVLMMFMMKK